MSAPNMKLQLNRRISLGMPVSLARTKRAIFVRREQDCESQAHQHQRPVAQHFAEAWEIRAARRGYSKCLSTSWKRTTSCPIGDGRSRARPVGKTMPSRIRSVAPASGNRTPWRVGCHRRLAIRVCHLLVSCLILLRICGAVHEARIEDEARDVARYSASDGWLPANGGLEEAGTLRSREARRRAKEEAARRQ